jgi:hypothetical protein
MGPGLVIQLEKRLADQQRWDLKRRTDPEQRAKLLAKKKRYRQRKAEKIREYNAAYAARNPEKMRQWRAEWEKSNRHSLAERKAKRRTAQLNAMPAWVDREAIRVIYRDCKRISAETGVVHHVDHIEPLQGVTVCGLHVPWNLQIIPATENFRKAKRFRPT